MVCGGRGTRCRKEHSQASSRGVPQGDGRGCEPPWSRGISAAPGTGRRVGRGRGRGDAQPDRSPRRPVSKPGFQESLERSTGVEPRSKRVVLVRDAWHLFMAVLLGKQIVFMSERKDHVSGQSLQLVRSNPRPQPHMPGQGASAPLCAGSGSLYTWWSSCRGSPAKAHDGQPAFSHGAGGQEALAPSPHPAPGRLQPAPAPGGPSAGRLVG